MTSNQPSVWPPVAGRSALRAVGFGLLAAGAVAALHAAFIIKTEYEVAWVSAIVGGVVGLTMRLSRPLLHRIWVRTFATALTLFSLLLSEYLLVHYGEFDSATEDPAQFFFWGLSLVVAARAAAAPHNPQSDRPNEAPWAPHPGDAAALTAEGPTYSHPSASEPAWNPSTAITGPGASDSMSSPSDGYGVGRPGKGPQMRPAWAMLSASIVTTAVGLATIGVLHEWHHLGAPPWTHAAGQPAQQAVGQPADQASGETPGEDPGRFVDYPDLRIGDCVRDMDSEDADLEVVPCTTPHTDEVVGTFTLPRHKWPGQKRVDQLADRGCRPRFEEYVGVSADDSSLMWLSDSPIKFGWPQDRSVVCTAAKWSGRSTGSVRGTGR